MDAQGEEFVSPGKAGMQQRRVRKDGWSTQRRTLFLDHYAATGNASAACRAAGMAEGAAYRLRRRDPHFAEQYDEAHAVAKVRLEGLLVRFSETRGKERAAAPGEVPPDNFDDFDPELALKVLRHPRPSQARYSARSGARPRTASPKETEAAVMALLKKLKKRLAGRKR